MSKKAKTHISMNPDTLRKARVIAASSGMSMSEMFESHIDDLTEQLAEEGVNVQQLIQQQDVVAKIARGQRSSFQQRRAKELGHSRKTGASMLPGDVED